MDETGQDDTAHSCGQVDIEITDEGVTVTDGESSIDMDWSTVEQLMAGLGHALFTR